MFNLAKRFEIVHGSTRRLEFFCLAGIIQTFFFNSTQTSYDGCPVSSTNDPGLCWTWGLTVNGYLRADHLCAFRVSDSNHLVEGIGRLQYSQSHVSRAHAGLP